MEKLNLILNRDLSAEERNLAVELAHLIGFCSISLEIPFIVRPGQPLDGDVRYLGIGDGLPEAENVIRVIPGKNAAKQWAELARRFLPRSGREIPRPEGFVSAFENCPKEQKTAEGGLEQLFENGWILTDGDGDGLPDAENCRFVFEDVPDDALCYAACCLAARLGMETTEAGYPLVAGACTGNRILFGKSGDDPVMELVSETPYKVIVVRGEGERLIRFADLLASRYPLAAEDLRLCDVTEHLRQSLRMERADGQAAWLQTYGVRDCLLSADADPERFHRRFPGAVFHRFNDAGEGETRCYDLSGEEDELWALLRERILPLTGAGDRVTVRGALGQDRKRREALVHRIREEIEAAGAEAGEIRLRCAFKQGFSWLEEEFAPRAAAKGKVAKAVVRFDPKNGSGVICHAEDFAWNGADEAVEKPPRWLQDLYPADEVMAGIMGISRDAVLFEAGTGDPAATYEAEAWDAEGNSLHRESCTVRTCAVPFLSALPDSGIAIPSTGYLTAEINGKTVLDERIATDAERVWGIYQNDLIPWMREAAENKGFDPERQPFFHSLTIDVETGGPERELETRTDHISSGEVLADALHLVGRQYFMLLGRSLGKGSFDAPGLILPQIHVRPGRPAVRATLKLPRGEKPDFTPEPADCRILRISLCGEKLVPEFGVSAAPAVEAVLPALGRLTEEGFTALSQELAGYGGLKLETAGGQAVIRLPEKPELPCGTDVEQAGLLQDGVIGYETCRDVMQKLRGVPGITVRAAGRSYQGRTVYMAEPAQRRSGYRSRVKRLQFLPTLFINGRHHSNEVSATNAIFAFIRELLTEKQYENLAEELNLILVPVENVDGAALHEILIKEHPSWEHQVCYTNSLGADLMPHYFEPDTIHTEANVFTRISEKLLPDAFIDLHGVPHHELPQQFGKLGAYKGLWLPRAMLCAFYFHIDDPAYPSNRLLSEAWKRNTDRAYRDLETFKQAGREWDGRFLKYSWNGTDESFPCKQEGPLLNYWIPSPYNPRHPYPTVSRPWIYSVMFTAEAADETASGAWLAACAEAHLVHVRAGVDFMRRAQIVAEETFTADEWTARAAYRRLRPVVAPEDRARE